MARYSWTTAFSLGAFLHPPRPPVNIKSDCLELFLHSTAAFEFKGWQEQVNRPLLLQVVRIHYSVNVGIVKIRALRFSWRSVARGSFQCRCCYSGIFFVSPCLRLKISDNCVIINGACVCRYLVGQRLVNYERQQQVPWYRIVIGHAQSYVSYSGCDLIRRMLILLLRQAVS